MSTEPRFSTLSTVVPPRDSERLPNPIRPRGQKMATAHGQILGRGPTVLYVRFQGEGQLISVAPQLLSLLPDEPPSRW